MMQELNYIRCGDYFIPDIKLQEETRSIGRWGGTDTQRIFERIQSHPL